MLWEAIFTDKCAAVPHSGWRVDMCTKLALVGLVNTHRCLQCRKHIERRLASSMMDVISSLPGLSLELYSEYWCRQCWLFEELHLKGFWRCRERHLMIFIPHIQGCGEFSTELLYVGNAVLELCRQMKWDGFISGLKSSEARIEIFQHFDAIHIGILHHHGHMAGSVNRRWITTLANN